MRQTAPVMDAATRLLEPADPAFARDPYPAYAVARDRGAVFTQPDDPVVYLTRYQDVHAGFRDRRLGSTFLHRYTAEELNLAPGIPRWRDPRWTAFQAFERWELLNLEPPVHTRLRRLVLEAFTPRAVEALRGEVRTRAIGLLAECRERGVVDLAGDYGQRFSLGIICDLIGVAPEDRETIKRLSDDTVSMYEPGCSDEQQALADRAAGEREAAVVRAERAEGAARVAAERVAAAQDAVDAAAAQARTVLAGVRDTVDALGPAVAAQLAGLGTVPAAGAQQERNAAALQRWQGFLAELVSAGIEPPSETTRSPTCSWEVGTTAAAAHCPAAVAGRS